MSKPTIYDNPEGPGPLGSTGSLYVEKEQTQHGIIKTHERSQHQGCGFATVGSNFIEKEPTQHGIVKSDVRSQHQGSGFATVGSIHVEKEKTDHGIVRSEEKSMHQGPGFATMGSLQTEKELVTHGIIAPGTRINLGPADASSDEVKAAIKERIEQKYDRSREQKARQFLEQTLGGSFGEENLQDALKDGTRLCKALNAVSGQRTIPKINENAKLDFPKRENINNYLDACRALQLNKSYIFETADLYEGKNMPKVIENILDLANYKP